MLPGFFCMLSVQLPPCSAGSLLPSASADGLKDLEAKPLPLWTSVPFIYCINHLSVC